MCSCYCKCNKSSPSKKPTGVIYECDPCDGWSVYADWLYWRTRKCDLDYAISINDDIFDKLDNERVGHLMSLVSDHTFGQVFITDTDADRID